MYPTYSINMGRRQRYSFIPLKLLGRYSISLHPQYDDVRLHRNWPTHVMRLVSNRQTTMTLFNGSFYIFASAASF